MIKLPYHQRGASLYLAVMLMSVVLAIALGINTILVSQLKTTKGLGDSVIAFYAADTAMEKFLYAIQKEGYLPWPDEEPCGISFACPQLSNGALYKIKVIQAGEEIVAGSKGVYRQSVRSLRLSFR